MDMKGKNQIPTFPISTYPNGQGKCWRGKEYWKESTLWEAAKDLTPFEIPIVALDTSFSPWELENINQIVYHFDRVSKVESRYPIILDEFGNVRDGFHRILKAITEGKSTIKAVRLNIMPPIDGKDK